MADERVDEIADVAIVGSGPAGLSAAAELRRLGIARVLVIERESEAGGIPRHCTHSPYGLREFGRLVTGPAYARRLVEAAKSAGVEIRTDTSVTACLPGPRLAIAAHEGPGTIAARAVLLATGVRETSRAQRLIGGTKPGGVLSTGALQGLVHLAGTVPFRRPAILGSELVAFSAILTCRAAGIRPVAMIEPGPRTIARAPAALLPRLLGIPLWHETSVVAVEGERRVEALRLRRADGRETRIAADGLVVTGGFRPEASLLHDSHIARDPHTRGPEVDAYGRTCDEGYFAAGNCLHPVETAGWCWEEGRRVARAIARALGGGLPPATGARIAIEGDALAYAVPARLAPIERPAFDRLMLRMARPATGRLSLRVGGREIAGRRLSALPERRLFLPLPTGEGPVEVRFEEVGSS